MKNIKLAGLLLFTVILVFGCVEEEKKFNNEHIMDLPPLYEQFSVHFPMIGNIYRISNDSSSGGNPQIINEQLLHHFNTLTAENDMKPSYLTNNRTGDTISYTFNNADRFVNAANNSGFKVIGHTLLWHSQNPNWIWSQIASRTGTIASGMTKEQALVIMKSYITTVVSRYAGKIHTWDVLNEIFPDNAGGSANWKTAMRRNASGEGQDANPWYIAIGPDFVYEGFLAARLADPNAILYYNDYNTDMPNRARLIRDMVKEVNDTYLASSDKPAGEPAGRLLIEGIGMQEHHNLGITAQRIKATIDTFRTLNVAGRDPIKLSVSELDIIAMTWGQFSAAGGSGSDRDNTTSIPDSDLIKQGDLYRDYMRLYIANKDIIERVSLWGVTDNQSWRSRGHPLLFDRNGRAKPAYYRFVGAL